MEKGKIYCPKCEWEPDALSVWQCLPVCGTVWNTFATGGVCPTCGEVFKQTQCRRCGHFSLHLEWYHHTEDTQSEKKDKVNEPKKELV